MRDISAADAKQWIAKWFAAHDIAKDEIEKNTAASYFEKGWIDSLSFISFIADLEDAFDVQFSNDEFQNRDFATIDGLANIVAKKHMSR